MKNNLLILAAGVASVSAFPLQGLLERNVVVTNVVTKVVTVGAPVQVVTKYGGSRQQQQYTQPPKPATVTVEPTKEAYTPPSPVSSPAQQPAASPAPAGPVGTDFKSVALHHHNVHRANHSSPEMTWDDQLADLAAQYAKECNMAHKMNMGGVNYGQNLANMGHSKPIESVLSATDFMAKSASDMWYNGEFSQYNNQWGKEGGFSEGSGHLTQLVWAGSTKVGCAVQKCPNMYPGMNGYITVCNYLPRGNVAGGYAKNVGTCKQQPTVSGPTGKS
jgi:uncharacterized protein YkwD